MNGVAQLLTRWNTLPRALRLAVGAAVLAMATIAAAAAIVAHPARTPLFAASLHPEQLAEVEERLAAWNVAFTPTAENVIVDARRRNDLLLRLSLAGVPHLHLVNSAEALESIGVLTPQAVIEAQTRAGLAGDIEAGLRSIDGVDDVRVIVAPAKAAGVRRRNHARCIRLSEAAASRRRAASARSDCRHPRICRGKRPRTAAGTRDDSRRSRRRVGRRHCRCRRGRRTPAVAAVRTRFRFR